MPVTRCVTTLIYFFTYLYENKTRMNNSMPISLESAIRNFESGVGILLIIPLPSTQYVNLISTIALRLTKASVLQIVWEHRVFGAGFGFIISAWFAQIAPSRSLNCSPPKGSRTNITMRVFATNFSSQLWSMLRLLMGRIQVDHTKIPCFSQCA